MIGFDYKNIGRVSTAWNNLTYATYRTSSSSHDENTNKPFKFCSFAGRRHGIVLQNDSALWDDPMVSRGRVATAGSLAGRDRRRFRYAQCDARIRIQSCPHPVGERHVPSVLPAPDDSAGTPSLRRSDVGDLTDGNLGETLGNTGSDAQSSALSLFLSQWRRERKSSLYIMPKFSPDGFSPRVSSTMRWHNATPTRAYHRLERRERNEIRRVLRWRGDHYGLVTYLGLRGGKFSSLDDLRRHAYEFTIASE